MHNGRLAALLAQKALIDAEIQREAAVPMPDQLRLTTLKRRKLMVKEQIFHYSAGSAIAA